MGISIVFAGIIVPILTYGRMRRKSLQPLFIVLMQAILIVIDEHTRSNVHGIYRGQSPLSYTALIPLKVEAIAAIGRALSNHN